MSFFITMFIVFVGGGWLIGKVLGALFFPKSNDETLYTEKGNLFVDNSTHHHFHVHSSEKSGEIKKLGEHVDALHDDVEYEDV